FLILFGIVVGVSFAYGTYLMNVTRTVGQALTLDPRSVAAQLGIARGELQAGREAVAAREYESALSLDAGNARALQELARIYSHERETWKSAETKYEQLLELRPDDAPARLELARVLSWERKYKDAVEMFSSDAVRQLMTFQDRKDYTVALVQTG